LTTLENIFTCDGKPGHEIVFLMSASFEDKSYYKKDNILCNENGAPFTSMWISIQDFKSGKKILYPEGLTE